MKTSLKIVVSSLLIFVGLTALYGGWTLMIDTSGQLLGLSVEKMQFTPFRNYFIPGLLLFFTFGCGSPVLLWMLINRKRNADRFVTLFGIALCAWIGVQMIVMAEINWLHAIYLSAGFALLIIGIRSTSAPVN